MANEVMRFYSELNMSINTSQASKEIRSLTQELDKISKMAQGSVKVDTSGVSKYTAGLREAAIAATELQNHIQKATNIQTGKLDLSVLNNSFRQAGMSIENYRSMLLKAGDQGRIAFNKLAVSVLQAEVPLKQGNALLTRFANTLKNTARWQLSATMIRGFISGVRNAFRYVEELNDSLTKISIVSGQNTSQMAQFAEKANQAAQALSTTTNEYVKASLIYYQQGLDSKEVTERTNVTIKMAQVSGQSAQEVSNQMTAVWNNFANGSKQLEYYSDVIQKLGATTASSATEIATGLEKFAAISNTVGLSYEYSTAALATVVAQTRQSADTVGTAFRTMFGRLEGLKLGETLEDGTDLNKYSKALASVGVSIKDQNDNLKTMDTVLDEIGAKWQTLSKTQQVALAQTVGGVRQYANLIALFDNWEDFQKNLSTAQGAEGTLDSQFEKYEESWAAAKNRVKSSLEELYGELIKDKFFIELNNKISEFVKFITNLIDKMGGFKTVFLGIGAAILTFYNKELTTSLNNFFSTQKMRLLEWQRTQNTFINSLSVGANQRANTINASLGVINEKTGSNSSFNPLTLRIYDQIKEKTNDLITNDKRLSEMQKERLKTEIDILKKQSEQAEKLEEQYMLAVKQKELAVTQGAQKAINARNNALGQALAIRNTKGEELSQETRTTIRKAFVEKMDQNDIEGARQAVSSVFLNQHKGGWNQETISGTVDKMVAAYQKAAEQIEKIKNGQDESIKKEQDKLKVIEDELKALDLINQGSRRGNPADIIQRNQDKNNTSNSFYNIFSRMEGRPTRRLISGDGNLDNRKLLYSAYQKDLENNGGKLTGIEDLKESEQVLARIGYRGKSTIESIKQQMLDVYNQQQGGMENLKIIVQENSEFIDSMMNNADVPETLKKSLDNLFRDASAGSQTLEQLRKAIEGIKEKAQPYMQDPAHKPYRNYDPTQGVSGGLVTTARAASSLAFSLQTLTNLPSIWKQDDIDTGKKLLTLISSLSMGVLMFMTGLKALKAVGPAVKSSLINIYGAVHNVEGATIAAGEATVSASRAAMTASIWIMAIVAAIALVVVSVNQYNKILHKNQLTAEEAKKSYSALKNQLEQVKKSYDDLKESFDQYDEKKKAMQNMVVGTEEWKTAVQELNEEVLQLLDTYSDLSNYIYTDSNGVLTITQEGKSKLLELQNQRYQSQFQATTFKQADVTTKDIAAKIENTNHKITEEGWVGDTFGKRLLLDNEFETFVNTMADLGIESINQTGYLSELTGLSKEQIKALENQYGIDKLTVLVEEIAASRKNATEEKKAAGRSVIEEAGFGESRYANQLSDVIGVQMEKYMEDHARPQWEDQGVFGGGKTDAEAQEVYRKAFGFASVEDLDNNKAKYYYANGEFVELSDTVAREFAALQETKNIFINKIYEYEDAIREVDRVLGTSNESVINLLTGEETALDNITEKEVEALQNFNVEDLLLSNEMLADLGIDSKKVEKLKNTIGQRWKLANEQIENKLLEGAKDLYKNLDLGDFSLQGKISTQELVNKIVTKNSQEATAILEAALKQLKPDEAEKFISVLNGIDWNTTDVEGFKEAFSSIGITIRNSNTEIRKLIGSMKAYNKDLKDLRTTYADVTEVLEGLKEKNIISEEDYAKLDKQYQKYFARMLDGTYKLMVSAEKFSTYVHSDLVEQYAQENQNIRDRRKKLEEKEDVELTIFDGLTRGRLQNVYDENEKTGGQYVVGQEFISQKDEKLITKQKWQKDNIDILNELEDIINKNAYQEGPWEVSFSTEGFSLNSNQDFQKVINKGLKDIFGTQDSNGMFQDGLSDTDFQKWATQVAPQLGLKTGEAFHKAYQRWYEAYKSFNNTFTNNEEEDNTQPEIVKQNMNKAKEDMLNSIGNVFHNLGNYEPDYSYYELTPEMQDRFQKQYEKILDSATLNEEQMAELQEIYDAFNSKIGAIPKEIIDKYNHLLESIQVDSIEDLKQEEFSNSFSIALSAQDFDEMRQLKDEGKITEIEGRNRSDAYNTAANQMYEEQSKAGLDINELKTYTKYLQQADLNSSKFSKDLKKDAQAAEDLAASIMKMNRGVESLNKNWETWGSILTSSSSSAEETMKALSGVKTALSDLTGINEQYLDEIDQNFIKEHAKEFENAAKGDEKAIDSLRDATREPVIIQLADELNINKDKLLKETNDLIKDFNINKINMGEVLTGEDELTNKLQKMIKTYKMSSEQAQAFLDSLGFDAVLETDEEDLVGEVPVYNNYQKTVQPTTTGIPGETLAQEADPNAAGGWELISQTKTVQTGTEPVYGKAAAFAMGIGKNPKIKKLTKKASGIANDRSSANPGNPDKSSGGNKGNKGSKSKKPTKDPYFRVEAQNKRLTHLYNQLEKAISAVDKVSEHLYGKARLNYMKQKQILLQKEVDTNKEMIQNLKDREKIDIRQVNRQKKKLEKKGVEFDDAGNISNYDTIYDAYNNQRKKYKKAGKSNEFISKFDEKWQKTLDEMAEYQKRMDTWDSTKEQIKDAQLKDMELYLTILENIQNANEYKLQLKLDIVEAQKQARKFKKYVDEELKLGEFNITFNIDPKDAQLAFQKVFKDTNIDLYDNFTDFDADRQKIANKLGGDIGLNALQKAINDGNWSENDKALFGFENLSEAMAKFNEKAKDYFADVENIQSSLESSWNTYLETLKQIDEQAENLNNELERINKTLNFQKQMIQLLYGDKAYKQMDKYYKAALATNKEQIYLDRQRADEAKQQFYAAAEAARKRGLNVDENDLSQSSWTTDMKQLYEDWKNNEEKLLDDISNGSQMLWEKYQNHVQKTTDDLGKAIWGIATDDMETNWDRAQQKANLFLDNVQKTYKIQDLGSKMDKDIASTKALQNQQKLQKLREQELKTLKEKQKVTQTDLDLAEARFNLMLKEIALRDAENNKNSMKLVRDANGDWTYQYVANMDEINEKQQDYNTALSDYYEKSKSGYEDMLGMVRDLGTKMIEEMNAVWLSTAPEEEKERKIQEIKDFYTQMIQDVSGLAQKYGGENAVAGGSILLNAIGLDPDAMVGYTEEEKNLVSQMKDSNIQDFFGLRNAIIGEDGQGGVYDDLHNALDNHFKTNNKLADTYVGDTIGKLAGENGLVPIINRSIQSVDSEYDLFIQDVKRLSEDGRIAIAGLSNEEGTGVWDVVNSTLKTIHSQTDTLFSESTNQKIDKQRQLIQQMAEEWDRIAKDAKDYSDTVEKYTQILESEDKSEGSEAKKISKKIYNRLGENGYVGKRLNNIMSNTKTTNSKLKDIEKAIKNIKINVKTSGPSPSSTTSSTPGKTPPDKSTPGKTPPDKSTTSSSGNNKASSSQTKLKAQEVAAYLLKTGFKWDDIYDSTNDNLERILYGSTFESIFKKSAMSKNKIFDEISDYMYAYQKNYTNYGKLDINGLFKALKITNVKKLSDIKELDTGGYTGNWDDNSGKLALLHKKELVLNAKDTENMLEAVKLTQQMVSSDIYKTFEAAQKMFSSSVELSRAFENMMTRDTSTANTLYITAEFPNANDVSTIREAILSLPNIANQYVNKK